jgi:hypothetical protein
MLKRTEALALLIASVLVMGIGCAFSVSAKNNHQDDPGPHVQYGGTPIELHFDAPGGNVTKAFIDGTPCIIVSFAPGEVRDGKKYGIDNPAIALSCNWGPR